MSHRAYRPGSCLVAGAATAAFPLAYVKILAYKIVQFPFKIMVWDSAQCPPRGQALMFCSACGNGHGPWLCVTTWLSPSLPPSLGTPGASVWAAEGVVLQEKQPGDPHGQCLKASFLLCGSTNRCRIFLSTKTKIVLVRKETTGADSDCCCRQRFVRSPVFAEIKTAVARPRLGFMKLSYWMLQLTLSFFFFFFFLGGEQL